MKKSSLIVIILVAIVLTVVIYMLLVKREIDSVSETLFPSDDSKKTGSTNTTTTRDDNWPLKKGSKGDNVKLLQIYLGGLTVDGDFGPKTETLVKVVFGKPTVEQKDLQNMIMQVSPTNKEKSINPNGTNFPLTKNTTGYFVKLFQLCAGLPLTGTFSTNEIAAAKSYFNSDQVSQAQLLYLVGNRYFNANLSNPTASGGGGGVVKNLLDILKTGF